jgi:antitoxin MazE
MRIVVRKWGNSAAVRIPASVMADASLEVDQTVEVREEDGRIVIEPVREPSYDLDTMLDAMQADTFPEELDFGAPKGREIW